MRIKALLCAVAVAALATSAVAQNVFSLNVVGYVNTSIPGTAAGQFMMIANPLNTTNNTVGALIAAPPEGSLLYKFNGTAFNIDTFAFGAWTDPNVTLNPGEGAIIWTTTPFTQTWVGEVMQGSLSNSLPAGFAIRASQVPQAGTLTQLGLPVSALPDGTLVYQFNPTTQSYNILTLAFGAWTQEPSLAVGESVWFNLPTAAAWTRTFTVQ